MNIKEYLVIFNDVIFFYFFIVEIPYILLLIGSSLFRNTDQEVPTSISGE